MYKAKWLLLGLILAGLGGFQIAWGNEQAEPVRLEDQPEAFILSNGLLTVRVDKKTADVTSLVYRGREMLGFRAGRGGVYWSAVGTYRRFSPVAEARVLADPAANGGERAIVSLRQPYVPGSSTHPVDVEIRYSLGRGESGLYAMTIWEHKAGYPIFDVAEARLVMQLNQELFDYICVDQNRRGPVPSLDDWNAGQEMNMKEVRRIVSGPLAGRIEHKYDYAALLAEVPAYGFISTSAKIGAWLINPSLEYIAGGPAKVELTAHVGPYVLNYWKGSHYGGGFLGADDPQQAWVKFVGPMLLYFNSQEGAFDADALWKDALTQAAREAEAWPYAWVKDPEYPPLPQRGTVRGRIRLEDPEISPQQIRNLWVGLTAPTYRVNLSPELANSPAVVDWQLDGLHYQFWTRGGADGSFEIPKVRPGHYVLRAYAEGVLDELEGPEVQVEPGVVVELGEVLWRPKRYGRTVWEIGVPNRSASEFRHGEHYWQWGLYLKYPEEFPQDVNFVVGQSDWKKDWNYAQPARQEADGSIRDTPWTVRFSLDRAPRGQAVLRIAICGWRKGAAVDVLVNGQPAGRLENLRESGVMHRDGIRGYWQLQDVAFDGSLLQAGENTLQLILRANAWHQGVLYDYLRLELAEIP